LPRTGEYARHAKTDWKTSVQESMTKSAPRTDRATSLSHLSNEELLERYRTGNKDAAHTLIQRYEGLIYAQAYRLAGNYHDANDGVAETYLRICPMLGSCRTAAALPAWISRVVSNAFYDICRRSQRCPTVSLDSLMESTGEANLPIKETV